MLKEMFPEQTGSRRFPETGGTKEWRRRRKLTKLGLDQVLVAVSHDAFHVFGGEITAPV